MYIASAYLKMIKLYNRLFHFSVASLSLNAKLHLFVCLIMTVNVRGLSKRLGLHYDEVYSKEQAEKSFSFSFSSEVSLKSSKDTIKSLILNYYIVSLQINLWDTPCKSNIFNKHFKLS